MAKLRGAEQECAAVTTAKEYCKHAAHVRVGSIETSHILLYELMQTGYIGPVRQDAVGKRTNVHSSQVV